VGEQWEVVNADQTVDGPMSKVEATQMAQGRDGAWIRPQPVPVPADA
jgi:hypothetical protein